MIFKEGAQQQAAFEMKGDKRLWNVLRILDNVSQLLEAGEIVITDALRPPREGHPSFHPLGRGVDIRTKGRSEGWVDEITKTIRFLRDNYLKNMTYLWEHRGEELEHLHLQLRDGEPV